MKKTFALLLSLTLLLGSISAFAQNTDESVKAKVLTDKEALLSDKEALDIGFTLCVSRDLRLPKTGENGSFITWKSSKESFIACFFI